MKEECLHSLWWVLPVVLVKDHRRIKDNVTENQERKNIGAVEMPLLIWLPFFLESIKSSLSQKLTFSEAHLWGILHGIHLHIERGKGKCKKVAHRLNEGQTVQLLETSHFPSTENKQILFMLKKDLNKSRFLFSFILFWEFYFEIICLKFDQKSAFYVRQQLF